MNKKDIVRIFALGGLDENGKNMYVVEINNDIFVLEAGVKYPEKSMPGIDIIIPDYVYLKKNKDRVKAYIITHGHDDNMGSLTYILSDVPAPVYCTKVTSEMIKDTAKKIRQSVNIDFNIVEATSEVMIANRKVNFFSTTHSVAQSMGVAISTTQGYIVYTGDFIIDSGSLKNFKTDLKALAKIAENDVLCLLTESSGATKQDYTSPHHKITPLIRRQIQENTGRTIIAMYTQNLFGIQEVINMAVEMNKKIFVFSKDMQSLMDNFYVKDLLEIPSRNKATIQDLKNEDPSNLIILITSNGEKLFRIIQRIASGELKEEKGVAFNESDLFIMAAPSTPGIEVIAVSALDDVYRSGASVINISNKKISSMHAQEEDLKTMISLLKPKYYFPVSGYYNELVANAQLASKMDANLNHRNILVYDNGMVAKFENGRYYTGETLIPTGELMIDGLGVFDAGSVVIDDRNRLAEDGVIILGISIDRETKEIIAGPDVQARGLFFVKSADDLLREIATLYVDTVKEVYQNNRYDYIEKKQVVRDRIAKHIKKVLGKEPMILSMVVEI